MSVLPVAAGIFSVGFAPEFAGFAPEFAGFAPEFAGFAAVSAVGFQSLPVAVLYSAFSDSNVFTSASMTV